MIKVDDQTIARMEAQHPGIEKQILRFEQTTVPACEFCASPDTAEVITGVIGRTIYIATATSKAALVPNGIPERYRCNSCRRYFGVSITGPSQGWTRKVARRP